MSRRARQLIAAAVLTLAAVVAVVAVAEPQLAVGDPIPGRRSFAVVEKPPPPKDLALASATKPIAVDLGIPSPVSVAPVEDPEVAALALALQSAVLEAGNAGTSAVHVMDADGRVVFDLNGSQPLIPASTAKLVTAAAALAVFGPEHRFTTVVEATSTAGPDGILDGPLVLRGGGDPTLVSQVYVDTQINPERPQTPVATLADQIVASGITEVRGGVVGVDPFLGGTEIPDGWPPRYLDDLDGTPASGLTVDQGFDFFDEGDGIRARAAADPTFEAAAALSDALIERGVTVSSEPSTATEAELPPAVAAIATATSPELRVLLTRTVQDSDNHFADTLFRSVGRRAAGDGAFGDAMAAVVDALGPLELDWTTTTLTDGSGLSRESAIPAGLLTVLNYRMTTSPVGPGWQDLMAVSGVSGTLENRLAGSIAELRLRGKTGSLGDVRAISGAVVGPDGRPYYFTVTSNELEGAQLSSARRLQDLVILALAADLYSCTRLPSPPDEPPPDADELPPLPEYAC